MIKPKILFIDRDGILLLEPQDQQVDHINKVIFPNHLFTALSNIVKTTHYKLVMVSNQDGLGTDSFPEKDFWPVQELLIRSLASEGILFDEICIDRSFAKDNSPYRKPNTGMLTKYLDGSYDLENSFVIGDRLSDMELAKNMNCKGILLNAFEEKSDQSKQLPIVLEANNWKEVEFFIRNQHRIGKVIRNTHETAIKVELNLDGSGQSDINTGLAFFDHMLDQISKHSGIDLRISVRGDLEIDEHHTIEDTAIALGEVFKQAIGKKAGIARYGFALPMDDCRAQVLLDFGGRAWLEWDVKFKRERIGDVPTEMFFHFFKSLSDHAQINLNIISKGKNEHHKIEAIFKAFARALKMAISQDLANPEIPTTKGML